MENEKIEFIYGKYKNGTIPHWVLWSVDLKLKRFEPLANMVFAKTRKGNNLNLGMKLKLNLNRIWAICNGNEPDNPFIAKNFTKIVFSLFSKSKYKIMNVIQIATELRKNYDFNDSKLIKIIVWLNHNEYIHLINRIEYFGTEKDRMPIFSKRGGIPVDVCEKGVYIREFFN